MKNDKWEIMEQEIAQSEDVDIPDDIAHMELARRSMLRKRVYLSHSTMGMQR